MRSSLVMASHNSSTVVAYQFGQQILYPFNRIKESYPALPQREALQAFSSRRQRDSRMGKCRLGRGYAANMPLSSNPSSRRNVLRESDNRPSVARRAAGWVIVSLRVCV